MTHGYRHFVRLSMIKGKEMMKHAKITQKTGKAIDFIDPHSLWQRTSNEETNRLLKQYLQKITEPSVYIQQEELDEIRQLTEYTATQDTGLAHAAGSIRRAAQINPPPVGTLFNSVAS